MTLGTKILVFLGNRKGISSSQIKEIFKVSLDKSERKVSQTIKDLKRVGAIKENKRKLKITGNGLKRLPRVKESLSYRLPYWLSGWTMLIFDIPEKQKNLRDQLRYRLKKYRFGMIQSSIWIAPRALPKDIIEFVKKEKLTERVKTFGFSVNKEDLDRLVEQAWSIKELDQRYRKYVEGAKEQFEKTKEYQWPSNDIQRRVLTLLAVTFKEQYHCLRKGDPELPRIVLSNDWQGFRAFHIYRQLKKYL